VQFVPLDRWKIVAFQPLIQAVLRNADPAGYLGDRMASFRDLLQCLNLEFFRVTFVAYDFSFCLSLSLRSVYRFRGDSLRGGAESVISAWWSAQNREEPWAYVWGEGLIDKETAERWCEAVWPEEPIEENWA
jgi:hypothetical protein